jgi:hypothetical protein
LVLISSTTASSSASIAFTGLSAYSPNLLLVFDNVYPATNAAIFQMLTSTNNGSSYATSGYTSGLTYAAYNGTTVTNKNSTSAILLTNTQSNSSSNGFCGFLYLYNINQGNNFCTNGVFSWNDTTVGTIVNTIAAGAFSSTGVNAIQFSYSTGNIASGTFNLYSIQQT